MQIRPYLRPALSLAVMATAMILLVAAASFSAEDEPAAKVLPAPDPPRNALGRVGAHLAFPLQYYFGPGCYVLIATLAAAGLLAFRRQTPPDLWLRAMGVVLLTTAVAAAATRSGQGDHSLAVGRGGIVGAAVNASVLAGFGSFPAALALVIISGVGLALAADDLITALPSWGQQTLARLRQVHPSQWWADLGDTMRPGLSGLPLVAGWGRPAPVATVGQPDAIPDHASGASTTTADAAEPSPALAGLSTATLMAAPPRAKPIEPTNLHSGEGVNDSDDGYAPSDSGLFESMAGPTTLTDAAQPDRLDDGLTGQRISAPRAADADDFLPSDSGLFGHAEILRTAGLPQTGDGCHHEPPDAPTTTPATTVSPVDQTPVTATPSRLGLRELPPADDETIPTAEPVCTPTSAWQASAPTSPASTPTELGASPAVDPSPRGSPPADQADTVRRISQSSSIFHWRKTPDAPSPPAVSFAAAMGEFETLQAEIERLATAPLHPVSDASSLHPPAAVADSSATVVPVADGPATAAPLALDLTSPEGGEQSTSTHDSDLSDGRPTAEKAHPAAHEIAEWMGADLFDDETFWSPSGDSLPTVGAAMPEATHYAACPPPPTRASHGTWSMPPLGLLDSGAGASAPPAPTHTAEDRATALDRVLAEFSVEARVVGFQTGPTVTTFELDLAAGVKLARLAALEADLARALKAPSARVIASLPGRSTVALEVPNPHQDVVALADLIHAALADPATPNLPLIVGRDVNGQPLTLDLAELPHLLVAGTTGSGKSVFINSLIVSLLMTQSPDRVRLALIDPKVVELSAYNGVPHLLCPVMTDAAGAVDLLEWACREMDRRFTLLAEAGVRNIAAYNHLSREQRHERFAPIDDAEAAAIEHPLPALVIVIDELADLMVTAAEDIEPLIVRLAQKCRAVGLHIIAATQRPSVDVVTGLIKANMPARAAFRVASRVDSRTILDQRGADLLLGRGDMLLRLPGQAQLVRAQAAWVSESAVAAVVDHIKAAGPARFVAELAPPPQAQTPASLAPQADANGPGDGTTTTHDGRDELFDAAAQAIISSQRGSVSLLQRKLAIGYGRASRLMDALAEAGIVGGYRGSSARDVLLTASQWAARQAAKPRD